MRAYVEGSLEAFDELYRRTSPRVFGYLLVCTGNRARAEDLLQITYSKMHRARDRYVGGAGVMPWLLAIARRTFLDEQRARKRRREVLTREGEVPEVESGRGAAPSDLLEDVRAEVGRLPKNYREAIELTKFAGLSAAEAALVLGATESAIKLRVHRGYERLRRSLSVPLES